MAQSKKARVKAGVDKLSKEISKEFGDEGKEALEGIFEEHHPKTIFAMSENDPEFDRLSANLIADLRVTARELVDRRARGYEQAAAQKEKKKAPAKKVAKKPPKKKNEKPTDIIRRHSGKIDRFSYDIGELRNGLFVAKINRKGRNIIEDDKAPKIYGNAKLNKSFDQKDDAETAVSRVINAAMIWYAERGITPRERKRRTTRIRKGAERRTPEQRRAKAKDEAEARLIAQKKRAARERKDRLLAEKVRRAGGGRQSNPGGRSLKHIPRANPSKPFRFLASDISAEKQAEKSVANYAKYKEKWAESLSDDTPQFGAAIRAYDALENARANYVIAGMPAEANEVENEKSSYRTQLVSVFRKTWKAAKSKSSAAAPAAGKKGSTSIDELIRLGNLAVKNYKKELDDNPKLAHSNLVSALTAFSMAAGQFTDSDSEKAKAKKVEKKISMVRTILLRSLDDQ